MMADYEIVRIDGVNEAKKGLKASGPAMRKEMRQKFKEIGTILSTEAQTVARSKGLIGTQPWDRHKGRLVNSIKPTAREFQVVVNETAKAGTGRNPNYRYPKIYEYGGSTHVSTYTKGNKRRTAVEKKRKSKTASRLNLGAGATVYTGSRAFMGPALENKRELVVDKMTDVTKAAAEAFGKGGV